MVVQQTRFFTVQGTHRLQQISRQPFWQQPLGPPSPQPPGQQLPFGPHEGTVFV